MGIAPQPVYPREFALGAMVEALMTDAREKI